MTASRFIPALDPPVRPSDDAVLLLARGVDLWVGGDPERPRLPRVSEARDLADGVHYLGRIDSTDVYAGVLREDVATGDLRQIPGRALYGQVDEAMFEAAGRALAVAEWDRVHRFCGRCATPTELVSGERARRCPACRTPYYPRISPAVIVLVRRGEEALLARNAAFPGSWFSTIAGFVEPVESLEQTVAREVKEEVGVDVKDVRYFGSQPWPFGRSLMIGFTAQHAGGEIVVDGKEIAEAYWFTRDRVPKLPPRLSIARQLIDGWLEQKP